MAKSHCTCTCIKSSKEFCVLCVKTSQECISVSCYDDLRYEKITLTHTQSYLFDGDYHLRGIPHLLEDMLTIIYKSFLFFLLLFFFAYFSFKQTMHGHIRERKEIPNYVKFLTLHLCYNEAYRCHFMIGGQ